MKKHIKEKIDLYIYKIITIVSTVSLCVLLIITLIGSLNDYEILKHTEYAFFAEALRYLLIMELLIFAIRLLSKAIEKLLTNENNNKNKPENRRKYHEK